MLSDLIRIGRELYEAIQAERARRNQARMLAELEKLRVAAVNLQEFLADLKRRGM